MRSEVFRFGVDKEGTKDMVRRLSPALMRLALLYTRNTHDAQDIVQTTWTSALSKRTSYQEHKGTFEGWVTGICKNACRDWARKHRANPTGDAKWVIEHVELPVRDVEGTIIGRRARTQIMQVVMEEFRFLNAREKDALQLRFISGLPPSEAALAMGISQSRLRAYMASGLGKLREAVDRRGVA